VLGPDAQVHRVGAVDGDAHDDRAGGGVEAHIVVVEACRGGGGGTCGGVQNQGVGEGCRAWNVGTDRVGIDEGRGRFVGESFAHVSHDAVVRIRVCYRWVGVGKHVLAPVSVPARSRWKTADDSPSHRR
jgi:hypothetical protein